MKQKIDAMIMAGLIFIQGFALYNKIYNSEINENYESETAVIMAEETEVLRRRYLSRILYLFQTMRSILYL